MEREEYNFDWNDCLNESVQSVRRSEDKESTLSAHDIEAAKKCEFIQLNDEADVIKLVVSDGFESQWERLNGLSASSNLPITTTNETRDAMVPAVSNDDVFVISLLGDTGDGKSFLADHLLPSIEKNRPIVIDETERDGSTTANITCFESASFLPELSQTNFLLLDYEGEKGSYLPHLLKHMNDQWTHERADRRRKAVSEYFPKLAYIISNVIILLSRDDFSKYEYISRCYDFAERATKKLQHNPYKPVIIMVHNYCSHSILQPIKEVTQQFFKMHHRDETEALRKFFEAVYCMRLPSKMNETSNIIQTTDTNQMFSNQIVDLKKLLVYIHEKHKKNRTLPHISWLEMTRLVVDILSKDRTIMMHMLLRQVLVKDPGDIEQYSVIFLFTILYNKRDIHSIRWFHFCLNFAMSVLARAIAIRFHRNMNYIPDSNLKNMVIREEARVCLEKFWTRLDKFRPCTALYMGRGHPKEKDHPVFCFQHKGTHHEHRTSEEVYGVPLLDTYFLEVSRLWSIHDVWSGEFESDDLTQETPTLEMHEKFYTEIDSYMKAIKNSEHALYTTLDCLFKQYEVNIDAQYVNYRGVCCFCLQKTKLNSQTQIRDANVPNLTLYSHRVICYECQEKRSVLLRGDSVEKLSTPVINKDKCVICMTAPQTIMLDPCHHQRFCKPCAEKIHSEFKRCPLCRADITKLIIPK